MIRAQWRILNYGRRRRHQRRQVMDRKVKLGRWRSVGIWHLGEYWSKPRGTLCNLYKIVTFNNNNGSKECWRKRKNTAKSAELTEEQDFTKRFAEGGYGALRTGNFMPLWVAANWTERCNGEENVCVRIIIKIIWCILRETCLVAWSAAAMLKQPIVPLGSRMESENGRASTSRGLQQVNMSNI